MSSFEARYPGECNDCGAYFEAGTLIRYDESDSIVHADADDCLTPQQMEAAEHEEPCPRCFCWHRGEC